MIVKDRQVLVFDKGQCQVGYGQLSQPELVVDSKVSTYILDNYHGWVHLAHRRVLVKLSLKTLPVPSWFWTSSRPLVLVLQKKYKTHMKNYSQNYSSKLLLKSYFFKIVTKRRQYLLKRRLIVAPIGFVILHYSGWIEDQLMLRKVL